MSTASDIGLGILANRIYRLALENTFCVRAGDIDIFKEFNRYMIIEVLEWNDTNNYLTADQLQCLESKVKRPGRTCNC